MTDEPKPNRQGAPGVAKSPAHRRQMQVSRTHQEILKKFHTPKELVDIARKYTIEALMGIVDIANSEAPAAVRLRAWEIVLERGYGKAPQAILIGQDASLPEGVHAMSVVDRILALRAAKDRQGQTLDLEVSSFRPTEEAVEDVIG